MSTKPLPASTAILVADLEAKPQSFDRDEMIRRAKRNKYHDFLSDTALNIQLLVQHLQRLGYRDLVLAAKDGKYDATREEADAWSQTPEAREVMAEFGGDAHAMETLNQAYARGGMPAVVKEAFKNVSADEARAAMDDLREQDTQRKGD